MKPLASILASVALAVLVSVSTAHSAPAIVDRSPLYVVIDTTWPAGFDIYRYSHVNGSELLLTTLRAEAGRQADFAGLKRTVVVSDDSASPPKGSDVLRLTWDNSAVLADYATGSGSKPKFLGVVSGYSYAFHPDHKAMDAAVRAATMPDPRADAMLRVQLQMFLYESFTRIAKLETSS